MPWDADREDYLSKYGPMLRILDSEDEFDYLASEPGYTRAIAAHYRAVRYQALLGYLAELETDFEDLLAKAAPFALDSPELARKIVDTRRTLGRTARFIRFRIQLERFLPVPGPAPRPGILRRLLVRTIPRKDLPRALLSAMTNLNDEVYARSAA